MRSDEAAYYAWVLAAVLPWETVDEPPHNGKGKAPPPFPALAVREGIKANNKLCDLVTAAHTNIHEIMDLMIKVTSNDPIIEERDKFGMAIRRWDSKAGHWRLQVLYAILNEGQATGMEDPSKPCCLACMHYLDSNWRVATDHGFMSGWQMFLNLLQELDVMEAPSLKRLIDGTQLAKALGVKPGRWMAPALEICVAWQLRHPEATDPAGAIEEVQSRRTELGIPEK